MPKLPSLICSSAKENAWAPRYGSRTAQRDSETAGTHAAGLAAARLEYGAPCPHPLSCQGQHNSRRVLFKVLFPFGTRLAAVMLCPDRPLIPYAHTHLGFTQRQNHEPTRPARESSTRESDNMQLRMLIVDCFDPGGMGTPPPPHQQHTRHAHAPTRTSTCTPTHMPTPQKSHGDAPGCLLVRVTG